VSRADPACPQRTLLVRLELHIGQLIIGRLTDDGRLLFTPVEDTSHRAAWLAE
jgi:hypothetical protein